VIVRVVVRLKEPASVKHLVHATRYEPVAVDAAKGIMAFDVSYRRVETVLNTLAESGTGAFDAYLTPTPKNK
jgi:hypothetical protein